MKNKYIIIILAIIFLFAMYYRNKKENIDEEKESVMYVPNCNMLNDEETCSKTRGCYYRHGCKYNWSALQ